MSRTIDLGITGITSEDDLCQLTHGGYDSTRDGGGEMLTFSLAFEGDEQTVYEGAILVVDNTSFFVAKSFGDKQEDYFDLDYFERKNAKEQYIEKFGKHFYLKWFQQLKFDLQSLPNEKITEIGRKLSELYLKRYSNYPQNNRDWRADPDGYYADKILFQPIILEGGNVNPECFFEMTAEEVLG